MPEPLMEQDNSAQEGLPGANGAAGMSDRLRRPGGIGQATMPGPAGGPANVGDAGPYDRQQPYAGQLQYSQPQQPFRGDSSNTRTPYNGSFGNQQQQSQMPYNGVEQWSGNHLGPSNNGQQFGYPGMPPGQQNLRPRHRNRNRPFGLINGMMNQGMRPRRNNMDQDPVSTDPSLRQPDQFADNPSVDADGVRHFANGQHFDLSKISIDQAIGAVRSSDPQFGRMNRANNPNALGLPGNNGLFPVNFGAFR